MFPVLEIENTATRFLKGRPDILLPAYHEINSSKIQRIPAVSGEGEGLDIWVFIVLNRVLIASLCTI